MPRLILLNGPPAAGKSTLARRWVDDHPLALNLDLDQLWLSLGRWRDDPHATGLAARELAQAMASTQLAAGRSVIVPQYLGQPEFVDQLADLAGENFRHVVLLPPLPVLSRRLDRRADHPVAELGLGHGGTGELERMYQQLVELAAECQADLIALSGDEDVESSYRLLVEALR
ncbi:MAG: AAA family ATPase [Jatrophihabitans sp.]